MSSGKNKVDEGKLIIGGHVSSMQCFYGCWWDHMGSCELNAGFLWLLVGSHGVMGAQCSVFVVAGGITWGHVSSMQCFMVAGGVM